MANKCGLKGQVFRPMMKIDEVYIYICRVYGHVVRHGGIRALGARRAPVGLGNHGGGDDPGKVDEVGKAVK